MDVVGSMVFHLGPAMVFEVELQALMGADVRGTP